MNIAPHQFERGIRPLAVLRYPPAAIKYWKLHSAIDAAIFIIAIYAALHFLVSDLSVRLTAISATTLLIAGVLVLLWINYFPKRQRRYTCTVYSDRVTVVSGRLLRTETNLVLTQLITVQSSQGPFLRILGLGKIELGTLGEPLDVGPLGADDADELCNLLLDLKRRQSNFNKSM